MHGPKHPGPPSLGMGPASGESSEAETLKSFWLPMKEMQTE